jgi:hypothetical protein
VNSSGSLCGTIDLVLKNEDFDLVLENEDC